MRLLRLYIAQCTVRLPYLLDFFHAEKLNRVARATVKDIVKVQCNLRILAEIEEIGLNGANIECSSDKDHDSQNLTFERFRTFTNFITYRTF